MTRPARILTSVANLHSSCADLPPARSAPRFPRAVDYGVERTCPTEREVAAGDR